MYSCKWNYYSRLIYSSIRLFYGRNASNGMNIFVQEEEEVVDYWHIECFNKKRIIEELCLRHGTVCSRDLDD